MAGDTLTSIAICLAVWCCRRKASMTVRVAGGATNWPGGAITQSFHTLCAEPLDPFGDSLRCRVEQVSRVGLAQPTFHHASGHRLSTFGRQRRILVDVHLVSPWNTEASPTSASSVQTRWTTPERPQLGAFTIILSLSGSPNNSSAANTAAAGLRQRAIATSTAQSCATNSMRQRRRREADASLNPSIPL
ncbi:hypothetical protein ACVWXO_000557 [Bradyrhizobium sp. LM2.7]